MDRWLAYWSTLGGMLPVLGDALGALGVAFGAHAYFKGELRDDPDYRASTAAALRGDGLLAGYQRKLSGALDWLDREMGRPLSQRAIVVCLTIAMVYAVVFVVGSWALGGPGSVGATSLLPELPRWQQGFWGALALAWLIGAGLMVYDNKRIYAVVQEILSRRVSWPWAVRLYRIGGAAAAASIMLSATS